MTPSHHPFLIFNYMLWRIKQRKTYIDHLVTVFEAGILTSIAYIEYAKISNKPLIDEKLKIDLTFLHSDFELYNIRFLHNCVMFKSIYDAILFRTKYSKKPLSDPLKEHDNDDRIYTLYAQREDRFNYARGVVLNHETLNYNITNFLDGIINMFHDIFITKLKTHIHKYHFIKDALKKEKEHITSDYIFNAHNRQHFPPELFVENLYL